jgi:hypothetical protein
MNTENIWSIANVDPKVFRTWPLQDQVNAWSRLTSPLMNSGVVQSLLGMGTFDGRQVDGNLALACVQLGVGNCQKMVNSGSCSGFADINGTTICKMADKIAGTSGGGSGGSGEGTGGGNGGNGGGGGSGVRTIDLSCVHDASGGCLSMSEAMAAGFQNGSGVSMSRVRSTVQMIVFAIVFLVVGSAMGGLWNEFSKGAITQAELFDYMRRGLMIVGLIAIVMSVT